MKIMNIELQGGAVLHLAEVLSGGVEIAISKIRVDNPNGNGSILINAMTLIPKERRELISLFFKE